MGIFDLFKPKRKKEEFDEFGAEPAPSRFGPAGFPGEGFPRRGPAPGPAPRAAPPMDMGLPSMPQQPAMGGGFPRGGSTDLRRDIETLSYKLDSLKSALDNISARLSSIESALRTQPMQEKPESGWTY